MSEKNPNLSSAMRRRWEDPDWRLKMRGVGERLAARRRRPRPEPDAVVAALADCPRSVGEIADALGGVFTKSAVASVLRALAAERRVAYTGWRWVRVTP
jgi:hypothetical protein